MKIKNLSNSEYFNSEKYSAYWSSTELKKYFKSPLHAKNAKFASEDKTSAALVFGQIFHEYMESLATGVPFLAQHEIIEAPVNPSTGKPYGKESQKYKDYISNLQNPITKQDFDKIESMATSLMKGQNSSIVNWLLKNGEPENSYFLKNGKMLLKCRPDIETHKKIFDWKTISTESFSIDGIRKQIESYHYGFSAAMYQYIVHAITGVWKDFFWIFVESEPPYDSIIVSAAPYAYSQSDEVIIPNVDAYRFINIIDIHKNCIETGKWHGLSSFVEPDYRGTRILIPQPSGFHVNKNLKTY